MAQCKHHEVCGREGIEDVDGESRCILHSKDSNKDKGTFNEALAEHRQRHGDNYQYFFFPEDDHNFSKVMFSEDSDFSHATFCGEVNFGGAVFEGSANFIKSTFEGDAHFSSARFAADANFLRAQFSGKANFLDAEFDAEAGFVLTEFRSDADFVHTTFSGKVSFPGAAFKRIAHFIKATFGGESVFISATFGGDAHFLDAQFSAKATFFRATFSGMVNFPAVVFGEETDFSGVTFGDAVGFYKATFRGYTRFSQAIFKEKAYFTRTMFLGEARFDGATFNEEVHFSTRFGRTSFLDATFGKRAIFSYPGKQDGQTLRMFSQSEVDFRYVTIESTDALVIRHADLQKCRFVGTDLRRAEITGAKWAQMAPTFPLIPGRLCVYEEIAPSQDRDASWYSDIERLYRELKQNYEDRRDFERAGDFHYGEKEMRRKNPDTPWGRKVLLWLYWLVSGYGERCLRPLVCAVVVLALTTLLYVHCGLLVAKDGKVIVDPGRFWEVAVYGLKVMTLLKPTNFALSGIGGDLVNVAQNIVGPLLIGLFGLAVRQRLKR